MEDLIKKNIYLAVPYSISVGLIFYVGLFFLSDIRLISFLTIQDITHAALIASIFIVPQILALLFLAKVREINERFKIYIKIKFPNAKFLPTYIEKIFSIIFFIIIIFIAFKLIGGTEYFLFILIGLMVGSIDLLVGGTQTVAKFKYVYFAGIGMLVAFALGIILFSYTKIYSDTHQICNEKCHDVRVLVSTSNYVITLNGENIELHKQSDIKLIVLGRSFSKHLDFLFHE